MGETGKGADESDDSDESNSNSDKKRKGSRPQFARAADCAWGLFEPQGGRSGRNRTLEPEGVRPGVPERASNGAARARPGIRTAAHADPPELQAWLRNTDGTTGYAGILADVQTVQYTDDHVWVSATGIPSYPIGPWPMNPNDATDQDYRVRIPRIPAEQTGAKTSTPLGRIGAFTNGVAIYNPLDAFSFQNRGVWNQNAVVNEAPSFDSCLGHAPPNGEYHHHQNPVCLYTASSPQHSPLVGFAFDGYPIYGAYGDANTDGTGGIKRIESSYRDRDIAHRQTLPDGTALAPADWGPPVGSNTPPEQPLGTYVEDFEYVSGLGDLDEFNGRFAVTPEYPAGTYAYYATTNSDGSSAYPYILGSEYRGIVDAANFAPGQVALDPGALTYTGPATGIPVLPSRGSFLICVLLLAGLGLARSTGTRKPRNGGS